MDYAVAAVGRAIEAALQETEEGEDKQRVPKYTLEQILSPEFRFLEDEYLPPQRGVEGIHYDEVE